MAKEVFVRIKDGDDWVKVEVANFFDPEKHHTVRFEAKDKVKFFEMKMPDGMIYNKVTGKWSTEAVPKPDQTYKVHLGCGSKLMSGYVNMDIIDAPGITKVDLEEASLPFADGTVTEVICNHVLEHIHNLLPLMNEIHRVLVPNGEVKISVPVYPNVECFQDPTHVRFFTDRTFCYWHGPDFYHQACGESYGIKPFSRIMQNVSGTCLNVSLRK